MTRIHNAIQPLNTNFILQCMDRQSNSSGSGRFGGKDPSVEALFEVFPGEKAAMEWFESGIWPDGRACPRCGHDRTCVAKHPDMPYCCSPCKRYFGVKTGTAMGRSKTSCRDWATAAYLAATHPKGTSGVVLRVDFQYFFRPAGDGTPNTKRSV